MLGFYTLLVKLTAVSTACWFRSISLYVLSSAATLCLTSSQRLRWPREALSALTTVEQKAACYVFAVALENSEQR